MEMGRWSRMSALLAGSLGVILLVQVVLPNGSEKIPLRRIMRNVINPLGVELRTDDPNLVLVDNGLVQVTFSRPIGHVVGIKYNGIDNLLEELNAIDDRGYWDVVWDGGEGGSGLFSRVSGTNFTIITQTTDQVEVSFSHQWDVSQRGAKYPVNVDRRYVIRSGLAGYYSYAIFERNEGYPAVKISQIRSVCKLQRNKFNYMAISDDKQRIMPTMSDRENGQALAYPEAVLLTNPSDPKMKGQVDDKYQYSLENQENKVHGWISADPPVGFWLITPNNEVRSGGPNKQDLTSHVGPFVLSMFMSDHYAGRHQTMVFADGEPWKKVYGPVLVYLNSGPNNDPKPLWEDAKKQMSSEVGSWPYSFIQSEDLPSASQRGIVAGKLAVNDRYINQTTIPAGSAYVGLAAPGEVGSWERESKGYQFWTKANENGEFEIDNVRPGDYNLYAWVPGVVGDYRSATIVTVKPGLTVQLGDLVYEPPRQGPTLWEIGIPDRSAAEFFVPDPDPTLTNPLFSNLPEEFRQYGLWDRYTDLYQQGDLIFTIGVNDYHKDWFFAHVTRKQNDAAYIGTTWQIKFDLKSVNNGNYTLQLALASANGAELQVRFNDPNVKAAHFSTRGIGEDNAIARHGIHGLYLFYSIGAASSLFNVGTNTIYLTQPRCQSKFEGVMYDYLRLEGPPEV